MRKIKRNFVKRERIRADALSNAETYINRYISTSSIEWIPSMLSIRFGPAETSDKPPNLPILHQNP